MKKVTKIFTIVCLLAINQLSIDNNQLKAQNVGINQPNPDPSAILDITSDSMGLLIPRMTTAQRNAIDVSGSPNSVMIFNTTTECFEFYYNGSWYNIACTCTLPNVPVATACSGATYTQFTANWKEALVLELQPRQ